MSEKDRFKQAEFAATLGIVVNIALAVLKGVVGVLANSRALIADAIHSASDVVGSFAVYLGLRAAKEPPDEEHPYGHGKAESIAAIIVSLLLLLVGLEVGYSSIKSFFTVREPTKPFALIVIVISIVVKEALFRYKFRLGTKLASKALIANAYEHRSDVYSSVAALVGVGASVIGAKTGLQWLEYGDPAASFVVAILVIKMAYTLGKDSIINTLDHVLPAEEVEPLKQVILENKDVLKINSLYGRVHGYYVIVDLKISVDPYITVEEGHAIGKRVKNELLKQSHIHDVFVHINPLGSD
ncbi:cation transporter [Bacillus sp. AGMB 02131]|uniref:Cation transporter n=1 Tax=Peribacillus faecalis TaxID=2772559 RepID=A0A927CU40_9BACI|nr:cation diffusion facilitator family transporter [Peribacillus faecalis]MBD3107868.1 cation transporter [Peribacillus faecalis]